MCLAARLAKADHDTNSKEHQRYRRFMYNIAIVMVHEIGHIFITLLTGGESNTPPSEPGDEGFVHGEAGRDLETILFGGHHRYTRNLDEDETQVCPNRYSLTKRLASELTMLCLVWRPSPG